MNLLIIYFNIINKQFIINKIVMGHIDIYTQIRKHICTYTHIYTHTYTDTQTHTDTTHTHNTTQHTHNTHTHKPNNRVEFMYAFNFPQIYTRMGIREEMISVNGRINAEYSIFCGVAV